MLGSVAKPDARHCHAMSLGGFRSTMCVSDMLCVRAHLVGPTVCATIDYSLTPPKLKHDWFINVSAWIKLQQRIWTDLDSLGRAKWLPFLARVHWVRALEQFRRSVGSQLGSSRRNLDVHWQSVG